MERKGLLGVEATQMNNDDRQRLTGQVAAQVWLSAKQSILQDKIILPLAIYSSEDHLTWRQLMCCKICTEQQKLLAAFALYLSKLLYPRSNLGQPEHRSGDAVDGKASDSDYRMSSHGREYITTSFTTGRIINWDRLDGAGKEPELESVDERPSVPGLQRHTLTFELMVH